MGCGRSLFSELGSFCSDSRSQWRSSGYQWDSRKYQEQEAGGWGTEEDHRTSGIKGEAVSISTSSRR